MPIWFVFYMFCPKADDFLLCAETAAVMAMPSAHFHIHIFILTELTLGHRVAA